MFIINIVHLYQCHK